MIDWQLIMLAAVVTGLDAVAEGFRLTRSDDHEQLERELPAYDALYAYCQAQTGKEDETGGPDVGV